MRLHETGWKICAQTDDRLGESILWHPLEEALYWIDFYGPYVHRQRSVGGPVERWKLDRGTTIGSLVFADDGLLLLAIDQGLYLFDPATGATRFFADPKGGRTDLAYNDTKVDRAGRYWVGTYNLAETEPNGVLYRCPVRGRAKLADEGFVICNGPAFSPDTRVLYFSDTVGRCIYAYDVSLDGELSGRRTHFSFPAEDGMPDGLTVDSDGNLWCALYGGGKVVCIDGQGSLTQSIPVPAALVSSLCFGGADLKTLFVTTGRNDGIIDQPGGEDLGGAVFMRQVDRPGLPEPVLAL